MSVYQDYYEQLGLSRDATFDDIKKAYREHSLKSHPDLNKKAGAKTEFIEIQKAYETLVDPAKRLLYDQRLLEESREPLILDITTSRSAIPASDKPQLIYFLIKISPQEQQISGKDPPLNLVLVIDHSTSMQGNSLQQVKAAIINLLQQMRSEDRLSVVIFNDRAEVLLTTNDTSNRIKIQSLIHTIIAKGGTEIYQGLLTGYNQIRKHRNQSHNNHIIIITDGRTYGDEANCYELAERCSAEGILITALGIGSEWDDEFMDTLVEKAGGSCYFVSNPTELTNLLEKEYHTSSDVYAGQLVFQMQAAERVKINSIFRLRPTLTELALKESIYIGNIQKHQSLPLLIEMTVEIPDMDSPQIQLINGVFEMMISSDPPKKCKMPLIIRLPLGEPPVDETPPKEIVQAMTRITLLRMQKKAWEEVASGQIEAATVRLQHMATKLGSMGENDLAAYTNREIDQMVQSRSLSSAGKKLLKYATRALVISDHQKERNQ